jgi:hypothetical protein
VNGFTSDAFADPAQGVALVRRQIQRLCPDRCQNVVYYEDGRADAAAQSVYAAALQAEGPSGTGLLGSVTTVAPADAAGFRTLVEDPTVDLIVFAHQLDEDSEAYDSALSARLCGSTVPAIVTDTRAGGQGAGAQAAAQFHVCSGAVASRNQINFAELDPLLGTLFDGPIALRDPGHDVYAYSVAAFPFDAVLADDDDTSPGATQLEGSHSSAFSQTESSVSVFFGAIASFAADRPFTGEPGSSSRHVQRWAAEVHFRGLGQLEPVKAEPPVSLGGLRLSVASERFVPRGGYESATVWAEVTYPTVGLEELLASSSCNGSTSPNGDLIFGDGTSVSSDSVPAAMQTYVLNDNGQAGDEVASDRVWSRVVPELGLLTGTYQIHYFAELRYRDEAGVLQTLHREEIATQYVGDEIQAGSEPCSLPAQGNVVFVDRSATGLGNGRDWENAFTTIQAGVDAAAPGMEVWVKEGSYQEGVLHMAENVHVYGGFAETLTGREGSVFRRNLAADISVLDGGLLLAIADMAQGSHLDGFTVRNGHVITGGVIFLQSEDASIANCRFENNSILQAGALLYAFDATLSVQNSTFAGNSLLGTGAAVYNVDSHTTLSNCEFKSPLASAGAVIQNHGSDVHLVHTTFVGGFFNPFSTVDNWTSNLYVTNSILYRQMAPFTPQIRNYWGTVDVRYSDIRGGWPGVGNIQSDPRFVSGTDLRLRSDSPCIDAADSNIGPRSDLLGQPRWDDPRRANTGVGPIQHVDMGAYERQP